MLEEGGIQHPDWFWPWLLDVIDARPGMRLLDAACGEGYGSALLARQAASVVGADISPEAVAHARAAYGAIPNLSFVQAPCTKLPLPDGSADLFVSFVSFLFPTQNYKYNFATGTLDLYQEAALDFDRQAYVARQVFYESKDGTKVPMFLVHRRGITLDGDNPVLLYGYGAYGLSMDPSFSTARLSLLDRGFVFAIAHVRGGQELGRRWYDAGKLQHKHNSFTDFIDVTRFLAREGYCDPRRVFAMGGSAGGLLMGAVANLAPGDYRGIVTHVPFVDVVTTMLDESLPLTTLEYVEWGDPREAGHYAHMLSYSPYDNVRAQDYPAMLVTTGLWDSQVQYFEPAKWVARLRRLKTDGNPLLLRVHMEAGHGGKSGRFERFHEIAEEYAFMLGEAGLVD